ncbi:MAG: EF-P lysine aminoacylase EpmA [Pirellulaceae bacterium]
MSDSSDFAPTATWEMLRLRAALLWRLRQFFNQRDFLEVETPLLSHDTVADVHIDPLPVSLFEDARRPDMAMPMWLQTSPEFGMKRLLAAGAQRIYQVTRAFRAGETGAWHNPEFTIVEWYRVGDTLRDGMELLASLAQELLAANRVEQLTYAEAFERCAHLNPHRATHSQLADCAARHALHPPRSLGESRDEWLNFLLAELVEPYLGADCPVLLYDYPASQAALARVRHDPAEGCDVAERFELYFQGVELANGYHELLESEVLRDRIRAANAARQLDGRYSVPPENRLLAAMDHGLPPCAGVALGFDRLVMVAAGKRCLREVMAFPIDRA